MIILKFVFLEIFVFFRVCGLPAVSSVGDYKWKVVGNHYDAENFDAESHIQDFKVSKPRLTKRDDSSELTQNSALGTIGNLMNIVNSNLNLNIKSDAKVACKACKTGIQMMKVFIGLSKSDNDLLKIATGLCIELKIMTEEVCDGLIKLNGPSIIHILRTTKMSPMDICNFLVKTDCDFQANPDHLWELNIPQPREHYTEEPIIIKENVPTLKVLHITDTHYDPHYVEGTFAECSLPLCCREVNGEPNENSTLGGLWGGWKCDIPERTLDNLLEHINKQHPDINYILWTGDLPPHDSWSLFQNESLELFHKNIDKMLKYFPNIPIFPALGNHETVPQNLFPSSNVEDEKWNNDLLFQAIVERWSVWLDKNTTETLKKGAFYTMLIRPGLRIVSLNTNYCYYNNWWLILDSVDPKDQLKWLINVLLEAEKNHEKVHIIGHIPPGHTDCLKIWQKNYYNIIKRFASTVTGQFFGHTHTDEFELFYDGGNLEKPHGVAYVGPSATTYTYLNPGYRIYYVDGDHNETTRYVVDHETWIMDLEKSNADGFVTWYKLYSAKESYNMTSLTPQNWHEFFKSLFEDAEKLELYYKHYWKNSPKRPICDNECSKKVYCDIRSCDQYGLQIPI